MRFQDFVSTTQVLTMELTLGHLRTLARLTYVMNMVSILVNDTEIQIDLLIIEEILSITWNF